MQLLEDMWPSFDAAVCSQIRVIAEDNLRQTLKAIPTPIEAITFSKLTFGEAPFRIESIWVNNDGSDAMEMDVGIRW